MMEDIYTKDIKVAVYTKIPLSLKKIVIDNKWKMNAVFEAGIKQLELSLTKKGWSNELTVLESKYNDQSKLLIDLKKEIEKMSLTIKFLNSTLDKTKYALRLKNLDVDDIVNAEAKKIKDESMGGRNIF